MLALCLISWAIDWVSQNGADRVPVGDLASRVTSQSIPVPEGVNGILAWLESDLVALRYSGDGREILKDEVLWYELSTAEWEVLSFEEPERCLAGRYGNSSRLPTGDLGFTYRCELSPQEGFQFTLHTWNPHTDNQENLFTFPKRFYATDFTFSPDMTQWIQEETGDGINNKLYHVNMKGELRKLVPDFYRAGSPSWAADGKTVAFAATKEAPGTGIDSIFSGLPDLAGAMYYPWDIYLTQLDENEPRVILADVLIVHMLKWSPEGDLLAFWGEYSGLRGIWILEMTEMRVYRLWPETTAFYWSPDGQRIMIFDENGEIGAKLIIISGFSGNDLEQLE